MFEKIFINVVNMGLPLQIKNEKTVYGIETLTLR